MRWGLAIAAIWALAGAASAGPLEDLAQYRIQQAVGSAAYKAGDFAKAEAAFSAALKLEPQRYALFYYLAAIAAKQGRPDEALADLQRLAPFGMPLRIEAEPAFASLKNDPRFLAVVAAMARFRTPLCPCRPVHQGSADPFIAEGLVADPAHGRILVSSIYGRRIMALGAQDETPFATLPDGLSPFGLRIDARVGRLWVAASTLVQSHGASQAQIGQGALLAYDLTTGALVARFDAPAGPKRDINDLTLGRDGTVYVSDGLEGSVFRLRPGARALELFAHLSSAQGMVEAEDGRALLVADYAMGLVRIGLGNGSVSAAPVPEGVTTLGMDGLVALKDGTLVATQNGVAAPRVIRLRLDRTGAVSDLRVLAQGDPVADPSLLAVDGDTLLVVGASQWAAFDDDKGEPARATVPWRILRLDPR